MDCGHAAALWLITSRVAHAGSGKFGADEAAEDAALRAGAQGILRQYSRVTAADSEVLARAAAIAATAMAERNPDAFSGALEEASPHLTCAHAHQPLCAMPKQHSFPLRRPHTPCHAASWHCRLSCSLPVLAGCTASGYDAGVPWSFRTVSRRCSIGVHFLFGLCPHDRQEPAAAGGLAAPCVVPAVRHTAAPVNGNVDITCI